MSEVTRKQIVIVEGCAGAGKSTFLERMAEVGGGEGVTVISSSLGKRSFTDDVEAGVKSFHNDISKIQQALTAPTEVVFIDRCFFSQQVYHCIRTGDSLPVMKRLFQQWHRLILILDQDLHSRLQTQESIIELVYLFLIPSVRQLEARRKTGGKEYPNGSEEEVGLYKAVSRRAATYNPFVTIPSYETIEDQDNLVRGFTFWMRNLDDIWACDLWKSLASSLQDKTLYGFQCKKCHVQSGDATLDPEDAPTCCHGIQMTPYEIER